VIQKLLCAANPLFSMIAAIMSNGEAADDKAAHMAHADPDFDWMI
jgi:hypothetical protein